MNENQRVMEIFMEMHRGLPRQGPGSDELTRRAIAAIPDDLPAQPQVLDIGCGPGMQSLVLAQELNADVFAVDLFQEFLDQLAQSAEAAGLADRIHTRAADMQDLPFEPQQFDVIWAEGSAYIMGIANALQTWKSFLKPGGYLVFSEAVWLQANPPADVAAFWQAEYPAITDIEGNLNIIQNSGYRTIEHFTLPDAAWWQYYYTPLEAKHPALREKYAGDSEALSIIDGSQHEIAIRRDYGEWYSYEFFITQPSEASS